MPEHTKLKSTKENVVVGKSVSGAKKELTNMTLKFKEEDDDTIPTKSDPEIRLPPPKQQRKAEEEKNDFKKLALLKNPKVKKDPGMALLPTTLRDRLKPIGLDIQDQYFTLDQATREVVVTRKFISQTYGGNMQMTCPIPARKFLDVHGMDDFMFLPTAFQPEAPLLPGAPGLWFNNNDYEEGFGKPQRVFVQVVPVVGSKESVYQFMGMYMVLPAVPSYLTVEEYAAQSPQFHSKWAAGMLKLDWGIPLLARVLLREELGREPTHEEVVYTANVRLADCKAVHPNKIKSAYLLDEERMYIWTMKCVGYDNNFQRELSEKFPVWVPTPSKTKKQKKEKLPKRESTVVRKTKSGASQKTRGKQLKVEEMFKGVPNVENESGDDLEYVDPPTTRSVKRKNEATPEVKSHGGNESDGGLEYVDPQPGSRSRKRTRVDIDKTMNMASDDDLEYVDQPVSLPRKKHSATPDAVPDVGSESDDGLEYVDFPVVSCSDEVISIADEDEMPVFYKLGEGTLESPICL